MTYTLRAVLMAVAVSTLAMAPPAVNAASSVRTYQLNTRIIEQAPGVGEYDGTMRLTVTPDGIISGYYRPNDGPFVPVMGGVDRNGHFWIDLSPR